MKTDDRADPGERGALERHLRRHHPNLLGEGHDTRIGRSPLPRDLAEVPFGWLLAVHDASHAGLWSAHDADDWLVRDADPDRTKETR
jgi:hypothetical protein